MKLIDIFTFERDLKKGDLRNCYLFCGMDELLIKENIKALIKKVINPNFIDLNYMKFDGSSLESFDPVINACETLPFMSEKKVVLVYRASFFGEDKNKLSTEFKTIHSYLKNLPKHCILIFYYVFKSKRDKPGRKIYSVDKDICIVKADKVKGKQLENKVQEFFYERGKDIKKLDLRIFCSLMNENNLSIIENEVEKLCCYTYGRNIEREDMKKMFLRGSDEDIFDLVNAISDKKIKDALHMLNELMYKGYKISYVLSMVERQFSLLFKIKMCLEERMPKEEIKKELNIKSEYGYSIMVKQSKKFTINQLKKAVELCLNTEKRIKSSSIDEKTEMELLIINTTA